MRIDVRVGCSGHYTSSTADGLEDAPNIAGVGSKFSDTCFSRASKQAGTEPAHSASVLDFGTSLILLIWVAGTGFLVVRLIGGMKKVRRIRVGSFEVEDPKLQAALRRLLQQEKMPSVPVRISRKLNSPVVVGPRRTTVILPEKLLAQLTEDQLWCVLAHELTHVRQRDPLIGLIQRIVEAGYWPHPFVHLLNRDLIRAREEVCDNVALHGTTAPQYADTLLTVALGIAPRRAAAPGGVGLMTPPWKLEERVRGLLDPHRRLTTTMNTRHLAFMAISLASGIALIAGASVVAAPNPPTFQQVVELHSSYNAKTRTVEVTAKSRKVQTARTIKASHINAKQMHKAPKTVTYYTIDTPPFQKTVGIVEYKPAELAKVQKIKINPKIVDPTATYSVTTTDASVPQLIQGKVDLAKSDSAIAQLYVNDYTASNSVKQVEVGKSDPITSVKTIDGKTTTITTTISNSELQVSKTPIDRTAVTIQTVPADRISLDYKVLTPQIITGTSKVQRYELRQDPSVQSKVQYYVTTPQDGKKGETPFKVWADGNSKLYIQDGKKGADPFTVWTNGKEKLFFQDGKKVEKLDPDWEKTYSKFYFEADKAKSGWSSKDPFKSSPWTVLPPNAKVRVRYVPSDANLWAFPEPAKHHPTTIYIKGGDIKIVGDDIKVVYEKADTAKAKNKPKTGNSKPKSK